MHASIKTVVLLIVAIVVALLLMHSRSAAGL
jgi:hypothetical protein